MIARTDLVLLSPPTAGGKPITRQSSIKSPEPRPVAVHDAVWVRQRSAEFMPHHQGIHAMQAARRDLLVEADGGHAHVIAAGAGPPVVLLHGLGGLAEEILAPLAPIAERQSVLAIDRPGYGFSAPQPEDRMRPDRQARWLADVVRMLGAERPIIVAHSFAASIALWLAYRHPKAIAGLVLIAPFCRPTTPAWRPLLRLAAMRGVGRPVRWVLPRIARRLAPRQLLSAFDPNPVPPHMHRLPFEIAAQPAAVLAMAAELRGFNVAMGRLSGRLYGLKTPTVLICGETDRVTAWDHHGGWLASRLPDCAVITVRDVGHMVHHVRPRVVAAAVDLVAANRPKRRGVRLMA